MLLAQRAKLTHGQHNAVFRGDVRHGDDPRAGRDRGGEALDDSISIIRRNRNRNLFDHDAVAFRPQIPAALRARMLLIGDQHLVARLQIQSIRYLADRHRRVLHQRNLAPAGVHQRTKLSANVFVLAIAADVFDVLRPVIVMRNRPLVLAHVVDHGVYDLLWPRAQRARVEIGFARWNEELLANPRPIVRIIGHRPSRLVRANYGCSQ